MAVVAGACAISVAAASAQAPTRTTNDGVYTAAQAERGKKAFASSCTTCHDTDRFSGATFTDAWAGKPMKEIWDVASGTMPEVNPGSLKQQEYADILAYFLALQGRSHDAAAFRVRFDVMALQRNMKALGTFGYQTTTRQNPVYIQYMPRTLRYARETMLKYPRFARLRGLLATHLEEFR